MENTIKIIRETTKVKRFHVYFPGRKTQRFSTAKQAIEFAKLNARGLAIENLIPPTEKKIKFNHNWQ